MSEEKVTYLGPEASYTHQATLELFPKNKHRLTPSLTIEDVFENVQTGTATYGVVPFENSSNGAVVFTLDLFADRARKYSSIQVCGENYLSVHHCLLGRRGPNAPSGGQQQQLEDISHVTSLHSHPQAWGQCKRFLGKHLKGIDRIDETSTSAAAAYVASDKTGKSAAVCSVLAAEVYGLDILAKNIEDESKNQTRFLVLRKGQDDSADSRVFNNITENKQQPSWKSLLTFTVSSHSHAGALADALGVFKAHGINLTSINTRPSGEVNWQYIFFVEFSGRKGDENVNQALAEIKNVVGQMRFLGSWRSRTN